MIKLFERNSTNLTISEFYDNFKNDKYNFNADYQRKSDVWSVDKQSFLIDSILKNYPIPAIFIHPQVSTETGKTLYNVIDGKQRLHSIISFINNKIPLPSFFADKDFFSNDNLDVAFKISGLMFQDIQNDQKSFSSYIRQFWTYKLNVEYLYEDNKQLVASVFDRLNRNGEPLNNQELRNAKYSSSKLLKVIREVNSENFWSARLSKFKSSRMEDDEFISELLFLVLEENVTESSPDDIDYLYERYSECDETILNNAKDTINKMVNFVNNLQLPDNNRFNGATHLYGLFSFAWYCIKNNIKLESVKTKIEELYNKYFTQKSYEYKDDLIIRYKDSVTYRTKSRAQRSVRLNTLLLWCNIKLNS